MTIIKNLINKQNHKDKKCENLITRCIQLDDLNLYLHNLDNQALMLQKSSVSIFNNPSNQSIDTQNEQLLNQLTDKVLYIIKNTEIDYNDIFAYAHNIKIILDNDVDIINLEPSKAINAYKTYIVVDIIINNLYNSQNQQKTL